MISPQKLLLYLKLLVLFISSQESFGQCNNCISPSSLNSGLVACYPLDGNGMDMISSSNNGTLTATTNATNRFGRTDAALQFNGTSSKIIIPSTNFLLDNYTYSVWVKITSNPTNNSAYSILSIGRDGILGDQSILLANNYSTPAFLGFTAQSYPNPSIFPLPPDRAFANTLPSTGVWYHLVATRNTITNKVAIFINGINVNEVSLSGTAAGYDIPIVGVIGARAPGTGQFFNGTIDNLRIYNRILSSAEILALYNLTDDTQLITSIGSDKTICLGDSVQLNATTTGATNYSWSPATGLSNPAIANPYAKPSSTQQYIVTVSNGTCSATDTVIVNVNANCCATCSTPDAINNGLVACYPFNANVNDESGNNIHGTATNIAYTTDRFGNANKAISLNGTSSYVDIANPIFKLPEYTYSVWVNVPSVSAAARSALSIGSEITDQAILLLNSTGYAAVSWNSDASNIGGVTSGSAPVINTWYHIVTTRSNSTLSIYINGNLLASASVGGKTPGYGSSGYGTQIGRRVGSVPQYFLGKIDDVRIYSKVLTASEVSELFMLVNSPTNTPITDKIICAGDSVQLTATGGTSYMWSPTTGLSNPAVANPYAKPSSTQQYIVTVSNGLCSTTDTVVVNVNSNCCFTCTTPDPINVGLVACYPFNANTNDVTNMNGNGTNNGATLTADRFGNLNSAYAFGNSKTVAIPSSTISVNTYTYSTWVKINTLPASGSIYTIIGIGNTNTSGDQTLNINHNYSGSSGFIASSYRAAGADFAVTGVLPTVGVWYHVVSVRDVATNKIKLYVNGVKAVESSLATPTATYGSPNSAFIGSRPPGNISNFNGTIDDVRIYNRALSDAEILQLFMQSNIPSITPIADKTICAGDSVQLTATGGTSYVWSPTTGLSNPAIANPYAKPSSNQEYIVTAFSGLCSSKDTIDVTIHSTPLALGPVTPICIGDSIQLNASGFTSFAWTPSATLSSATISNPFAKPTATTKYYVTATTGLCSKSDSVTIVVPTPIADAGANQQICPGDSIMLQATGGTAYKWGYNLTLSDTGIANPYAKPTTTTKYYVSVNNGTCSAIDSVTLTIATSIIVDAGTNRQICLGDSIQLGATGAANLKWNYNLTLSDSTISNPFAKPTSKTKYFVLGTSGSCSASDSVEIDVSTITVDAGSNQNICGGDSIQLLASGGTSYNWRYNTTLSDSTIANPFAKPATTTQYFVTVSDAVCKAIDSVTVTILTTVNVNAGVDQQLCLGDSVQLLASGATIYTWLPVTGLSNASINNPKASPILTTDYIVKGEILTCVDYDTLRIVVNPLPTIDFGPDTTKCINDDYTFNPTIVNADQYLWSPALTLSNTAILNPTTNTTVPQTFTLEVTNSVTGCKNIDSVIITIQNPQALFSLSDSITQHPPLVVNTTNNSIPLPLTFQWFVDDSIPSYYTSSNPSHTFQFVGKYPVRLIVTDAYGCSDTLTRFVTINNHLGVFIPNVFTPNSDGLNDFFQLRYDISNTTLLTGSIWNRWGAKIYDFSMPNGEWWSGKANGMDAAADVYYYIITIIDKKNETTSHHGTITLLR